MTDFAALVAVMDWYDEAACKGKPTDMWFPDRGDDVRPAKAICNGCPVQVECLDYALTNGIKHGIWGGAPERARRKMRRELGLADPPESNEAAHGTRVQYAQGCRCSACSRANADYQRRWRERRGAAS